MNRNQAKFKYRIKMSKEIKTVLYQCLLFALGFFLTPVKFIFDVYPFSLALRARGTLPSYLREAYCPYTSIWASICPIPLPFALFLLCV